MGETSGSKIVSDTITWNEEWQVRLWELTQIEERISLTWSLIYYYYRLNSQLFNTLIIIMIINDNGNIRRVLIIKHNAFTDRAGRRVTIFFTPLLKGWHQSEVSVPFICNRNIRSFQETVFRKLFSVTMWILMNSLRNKIRP